MTVQDLINTYLKKIEQANMTGRYVEIPGLLRAFTLETQQLSISEDTIATELQAIAESPGRVDVNFWITIAYQRLSPKYVEPLCAILECEKCGHYEEVVDLLYELADSRAIPSLELALAYKIPSDPSGNLAVKILQTLANIGSPEALEIIKGYLTSPSEKIREVAEILLEE